MEHIITGLEIDGHYCSGNIAEFWSMPDAERMRAHEVMLDSAGGRIPLIAGCHHQSVKQAARCWRNTPRISATTFVIVLYALYRRAQRRRRLRLLRIYLRARRYRRHAVQHPGTTTTRSARNWPTRLAALPNICAYKQGDHSPAATHALMRELGDALVISVADEAPWLQSMTQLGLQWLINYNPHLYQVPGYLPVKDYTERALAGDIAEATKHLRQPAAHPRGPREMDHGLLAGRPHAAWPR